MAENTDTLGAGTFGGNGFWVARQTDYPAHQLMLGAFADIILRPWPALPCPSEYNTNNISPRAVSDALNYDASLLKVEGQEPVEFWLSPTTAAPNRMLLKMFGPGWIDLGLVGTRELFGRSTAALPDINTVANKVLLQQADEICIISATHVAVGQPGYTDTLPGLFMVAVVPGSVVAGVSAQVTVSPYPNQVFQYGAVIGTNLVDTRDDYEYTTLYHPYCTPNGMSIAVDLSTNNSNVNVIPGVAINFDSSPQGYAVISAGFEYVNGGTFLNGDVTVTDFYLPQSCEGPANGKWISYEWTAWQPLIPLGFGSFDPYLTSPIPYAYELLDEMFCFYPANWYIYNVTGALQTGCKFSIVPFVRLDQEATFVPFVQFFMGLAAPTALPESLDPYQITFYNVNTVAGTVLASISPDYPLNPLILEINPSTFQPTGVQHADGRNLKCDGTTLYRWDALAVYFVLSTQITEGLSANVHVRKGQQWHKYVGRGTGTSPDGGTIAHVTPPVSETIGVWGAYTVTDSNGTHLLPSSAWGPASEYTGAIQTQGYELDYANSALDAVNTMWYNHYAAASTYSSNLDATTGQPIYTEADNPLNWAIVVTCDDPRYFQVVPMTALVSGGPTDWRFNRPAGEPPQGLTTQLAGNASVIMAGNPITAEFQATAVVPAADGTLVVRADQLPAAMLQIMADHGVTVGS